MVSKLLLPILLLLALVGCQEDKVRIASTQIVAHPSLNLVHKGMMDVLRDYEQAQDIDIEFVHENAQGNVSTAVQIAQKFAGMVPEVVVAISTPSAQSVLSATRKTKTPVVFAAISDPISANMVKTLEHPGGRITGVMDAQPIESQLELMKDFIPELSRLGVVYNPGELNSVSMLAELKDLAIARDITILEATASVSNEVSSSAQSLIAKNIDAIYVPLDNTVVSALDSLLKTAYARDIPVFSADPDLVKQGVLASRGVSYEAVGRMAGALVIQIIEGEEAGDLDIIAPQDFVLAINEKTAERLGIEIPSNLK